VDDAGVEHAGRGVEQDQDTLAAEPHAGQVLAVAGADVRAHVARAPVQPGLARTLVPFGPPHGGTQRRALGGGVAGRSRRALPARASASAHAAASTAACATASALLAALASASSAARAARAAATSPVSVSTSTPRSCGGSATATSVWCLMIRNSSTTAPKPHD